MFLAGLSRAEREIAKKLKALAVGEPPWPSIDTGKAIPWVEKRTKLALAGSQIEAVRVALASKVLVIHAIEPASQPASEIVARVVAEAEAALADGSCKRPCCRQRPRGILPLSWDLSSFRIFRR